MSIVIICSSSTIYTLFEQVNGLFECTPDMLDTLSNRVDYLEKICQKVEASKKRSSSRPKPLSFPSPSQQQQQQQLSQILKDDLQPMVTAPSLERHSGGDGGDNKEMDLKKQTAADDSAEKKFSLSSLLDKKLSPSAQHQQTLISIDPATLESLKSILNVRNQLKSATLDLMDRVKKAEEGVLTNLK